MPTHPIHVGAHEISILHSSSFHHGHLCIFSIKGEGIATVYMTHIDSKTVHGMTRSRLAQHLLDDLRKATALATFHIK